MSQGGFKGREFGGVGNKPKGYHAKRRGHEPARFNKPVQSIRAKKEDAIARAGVDKRV
jgi:hypothetical protein